MQELLEKIEKRRTFAIISHPDAAIARTANITIEVETPAIAPPFSLTSASFFIRACLAFSASF